MSKNMILVISGGGFRAFYALGILKAIEELGIKNEIKACYGVSGGAITLSFRLSGHSAEEIYNIWTNINYWKTFLPNLQIPKSLIPKDKIYTIFNKYLRKDISNLEKKLYIGATDLKTGKYSLFSTGNLKDILFGSMSIPGIFTGSEYKEKLLIDGGVLNNFPARLAKDKHKKEKIIGILLNKTETKNEIIGIKDTLWRSFNLVIESNAQNQIDCVDILFYEKLGLGTLEVNKEKFKKIFAKGYKDGLKRLS